MRADAEPRRADQSRAEPSELRIDPPHVIHRGDPHITAERHELQLAGGAEASAAVRTASVERSVQQPREQATELADRLQNEREELDLRERQLAAQEADLEAKLRNARSWWEERQRDLDQRAELLTEQETELAARE